MSSIYSIYEEILRLVISTYSKQPPENIDETVSEICGILYSNINEDNILLKQKFLLIISNIIHSDSIGFQTESFIKTGTVQNLIPYISPHLDELLTNIPKINIIVKDLILDLEKVLSPQTFKHIKRKQTTDIIDNLLNTKLNIKSQQIAKNIELSCFLYSILINKEYKTSFNEIDWEIYDERIMSLNRMYEIKLKTILGSICNEKFNQSLLKSLTTDPEYSLIIAFLTRKDLLPQLYDNIKNILDSEIKSLDNEDYTQYESDHTCKRCKKNYVKITQLQLRSADEPMTTFYICMYPKCRYKEKE